MHAGWHGCHAVAWNWALLASGRSSGGSRYAASWCSGILVTPGSAVVARSGVWPRCGGFGMDWVLACADAWAGAGGGGGAAAAQGAATGAAGGSA